MHAVENVAATKVVVRPAVNADIPGMVFAGKHFYDESRYAERDVVFSPFRLHGELERFIGSEDYGCFVVDRGGEVAGVACAARYSPYFSESVVGIELFWWIDPTLRGSPCAIRALRLLEGWSREAGCVTFAMVDLAGIDGVAPDIYARLGYQLVERTWIRRL